MFTNHNVEFIFQMAQNIILGTGMCKYKYLPNTEN